MLIKCPECKFVAEIDAEDTPRFECEECETKLRVPGTPPRRRKRGSRSYSGGGMDTTTRNLIGAAVLVAAILVGLGVWGWNLGWFAGEANKPNAAGNANGGQPNPKEGAERPEFQNYMDLMGKSIRAAPMKNFRNDKRESDEEDISLEISDFKFGGQSPSKRDYYTFKLKFSNDKYKNTEKGFKLVCLFDGFLHEASISQRELNADEQTVMLDTFFLDKPPKTLKVWIELDSDLQAKVRGKKLSKPVTFTK